MFEIANEAFINPYLGSSSLALMILFIAWTLWSKRPRNSPPGSNGVPLLGNLLSLRSFPERVMTNWGKKYGPIYMVYFGNTPVVVLGTPEIAHEAFAKNDTFNDRPQTIPAVCSGKGILMIDSSDFQREQRRFDLHALREFGMGRRSLEGRLVDVSGQLCKTIDDLCGNGDNSAAFPVNGMIYQSVSSVISYIIFNHDVTVDDNEFDVLLKEMSEPKIEDALSGVLMFAPKLKYLPYFAHIWKKSEEYRDNLDAKIKEEVLFHQKSCDRNNPRDFIDCYLNEMDNILARSKGNTEENGDGGAHILNNSFKSQKTFSKWQLSSSFTIDQLVPTIRDLFMAGTETTATTICWILLFLSHYKDVQEKMQREIDEVLGQSGVPSMSITEKLPYVRAVLQEVSRLRPPVPLSLPHMASRDAILNGYVIPKGAIILTNIWGIQHDESRWPEPEKFLPERHLDDDGKFNKSSNWMIFNVGLRNCLGQQLAKMELFIVTISLFQKFSFALPPGTTPDMEGQSRVTLRPRHFDLIATRR